MTKELNILHLEDREVDAELVLRELRGEGLHFTTKRVLTKAGFQAELRNPTLDLILADYALPSYDGLSALAVARQERPEVPFIFVTGTMGEENAIQALHQGATDYVLKQRLSRLCPAVRRALLEVEERQQREQSEKDRCEAENRFRTLFEQSPDGIVIIEPETARILEFNEAAHRQLGYSREEFAQLSIPDIEAAETPTDTRARLEGICRCRKGKEDFETRQRTKQGEIRDVHVTAQNIDVAGRSVYHAIWRDITERKLAETRIRHLNEVLRAVRDVNELIVRERDPERLLAEACSILARTRGYHLVWVGLARSDSKRVVPAARAGERSDYLDAVAITWDESDTGRGPVGTAFRTRQTTVCQNTATDPLFAPWRESALSRGYNSVAAVPLIYGPRLFGALTVYADRPEAFDEEELALLSELANDLAFTLQSIEDEDKRKQAEAALSESQANLTRAESFSHIMVCHAALDGRWLKAPLLLGKLLGYSATELLAGRIQDHFHPGDAAQNWQQLQRLTVSDCQTFGDEKRFVDRQGAILWLDFHCTLVSAADQKPVMFLFYLRDITQSKRWEEKMHQQARLLNLAPDAIILRNTDDVIFYWNKGAERLYGWTAEEAIGRKIDIFCKNIAMLETAKRMVMESREWAGEAKQVTKAGQEVTVSSRWTLLNEPGRPPVILAINTDITEQKKLEMQFLRAQRLESIGRLASGIAHDLNNILAPMLMAPAILREELKSESSKGFLKTIEANAMRGAEIVRQLLTFGRGTESQRGPIQLRSLIREMVKIMQATFPKNITPCSQTPSDPWLVTADATQLHQVLMNLCVNASDAMPKGGELTLALENILLDESIASRMPGSKAGPYVLLTVTDTGTGIAPEHSDQIFDPFFTTKEPGQGTGLGLSTVLGIVRSHGGFVLVESQVGKGTQFMVYLPANMTTTTVPAEEPEELIQGSGELILVVDDEESIRIMLRRTLAQNGYRALLAGDGTEALAVYTRNQHQVQAVVADMLMPFMDGPSLVRALHKINPQVKILAVSGQLLASEFGEIPGLEARFCLSKPFKMTRFLKTLKELLQGKATGGAEPAARVN